MDPFMYILKYAAPSDFLSKKIWKMQKVIEIEILFKNFHFRL